jgi:hypothetical protein
VVVYVAGLGATLDAGVAMATPVVNSGVDGVTVASDVTAEIGTGIGIWLAAHSSIGAGDVVEGAAAAAAWPCSRCGHSTLKTGLNRSSSERDLGLRLWPRIVSGVGSTGADSANRLPGVTGYCRWPCGDAVVWRRGLDVMNPPSLGCATFPNAVTTTALVPVVGGVVYGGDGDAVRLRSNRGTAAAAAVPVPVATATVAARGERNGVVAGTFAGDDPHSTSSSISATRMIFGFLDDDGDPFFFYAKKERKSAKSNAVWKS